jgi:RNA 2',3'-cyclic 3'-phosphodiesterase
MHRLFVGFRPPLAIRERLLPVLGGVPGARWQSDAQLHVTLRFIGEVERPVAEDVALALANVRHAPIEAALAGMGRFGRKGRTTALWAGLTPHEPLAALHRKIDQALVRCGLAPEGRAYLPHVTLARLNMPDIAAERFLETHAGLASPPFTLDHFLLFESHLGREAASYAAVERYPLRG